MLLVSSLCPLHADATEPAAPAQKQAQQHREHVPAHKTVRKNPAKKKHPAATTFTPSEKIGADTVIAFPVDI